MKYEEYKNSGIEWIGDVPSHWEVMKTSLAFHHIGSGTTPSTSKREYYDDEGAYWLQTGDLTDGLIIDTSKKVSKIAVRECNLKFYPKNSVVIAMYGATIGKMGLLQIQCATNQACCVLPYNKHFDARYTFYFFLSAKSDLLISAIGGGQPNISQDVIKKTKITFPPLIEQQAIAAYLDKKCGEINRAIDIQKKKIDLLNELKQTIITDAVTKGLNPNAPMKDSGVEWIGEVPKHWEVMKLNFACKKITDFVASGSFADLRNNVTYLDEPDYAMLVRTADLSGKDKAIAKVYVSKHSYKFLSNSNLFGGEVILPNIGASIGDVYIVPEHIYEKATLGPNSIMLISKTDNNFLYYLFRSKRWREALIILGQAAAQSKFNKTEVRGLKVIIPPITEQQTIVAHIEKKVSKMDLQISKANRRIELLEELKQSIITEAVTGKIKVC